MVSKLKLGLIFVFLLVGITGKSFAVVKTSCDDAATTSELISCSADRAQEADDDRNEVYSKIVEFMQKSDDETVKYGIEALIASEKAWIEFRDKWCVFKANSLGGGSMGGIEINGCLETMTVGHTKQLEETYDSYKEAYDN